MWDLGIVSVVRFVWSKRGFRKFKEVFEGVSILFFEYYRFGSKDDFIKLFLKISL